ncbi:MAG: AraC family transcriptional regulator ligand-binding domain-containing protein [Vibrio sp.]
MTYFIRAACLKGYEDIVRSYGQNPTLLLKNAGILPSQLNEPETFIYYEHFLKALDNAKVECRNELFGLELGLRQNIQGLGMIHHYIYRQETILDALIALNKYIHIYAEGFSISITLVEDQYQIQFHHLQQTFFTAQKSQFTLAACFSIVMELLDVQDNVVSEIHLKQPTPNQSIHYFEHVFGCQIQFNEQEDTIYIPQHWLMRKPVIPATFNPLAIEAHSEIRKNTPLHPNDKIIDFIKQTIKSLLATGECNKDNIALCMGIHPKKLQRLLAENHTNYRAITEEVRKQEAIKLLQQPLLPISMIALKLGYADIAIFSRNFKTWFKQSPSQWRENIHL